MKGYQLSMPGLRPGARHEVNLDRCGLLVDGKPVVLLAASTFYFRIPRREWNQRLDLVRQCGYNAVDVYFPWNYHEVTEGRFEFEGERDAGAFLRAACDAGLFVIARPGPYICGEWDGGGLPAWLYTKPGIELRQHNEEYLQAVSRWFDRILAIIGDHQITQAGSVVLVQIENELDFFPCRDRSGYMSRLLQIARGCGIEVPIIACAGRGDVEGATGNVEGIVPTVNFYRADEAPGIETELATYVARFASRNLPLIVTETDRSHLLLRRLLSAGVKGVGPFLQVSGTNFAFTNSINDWKVPFACLATNNDFGGMIDAMGGLRPEAYEARLLGAFLSTFADELADSTHEPPGTVKASNPALGTPERPGGPRYVHSLRFGASSRFVFVSNLTQTVASTRLGCGSMTFPSSVEITVAPRRVEILPVDLQLDAHGAPGVTVVYSGAEVVRASAFGKEALVVAHSAGGYKSEMVLTGVTAVHSLGGEVQADFEGDARIRLTFTPAFDRDGIAILETLRRQRLVLLLLATERAARTYLRFDGDAPWAVVGPERASWQHEGFLQARPGPSATRVSILGTRPTRFQGSSACSETQGIHLCSSELSPGKPAIGRTMCAIVGAETWGRIDAWAGSLVECGATTHSWHGAAMAMEALGLLSGMGVYSGVVKPDRRRRGFIFMERAADIINLRLGPRVLGTVLPAGGSHLVPSSLERGVNRLEVKAEIWGHTNFHHHQAPCLSLGSLKGIVGGVGFVSTEGAPRLHEISFGTYRLSLPSTIEPEDLVVIRLPKGCTGLSLDGRQSPDTFSGIVRADPDLAGRGADHILEVRGGDGSAPEVLWGKQITEWRFVGADPGLLGRWTRSCRHGLGLGYPLEIDPGNVARVKIALDLPQPVAGQRERFVLRFKGSGLKLTAFTDGEILGRLWLPSEVRPCFDGGDSSDWLYLPADWARATTWVYLFIEAVGASERARLECVELESMVEPGFQLMCL